MKTALITGVTGQDGSYLSEFLLEKGYEVHGIKRRSSSYNTSRIDHLMNHPRFHLHYGDMTDSLNLINLLIKVSPDEIYNFAAQSHVAVSFDTPEYTGQVDALGTLRLLEAVRILGMDRDVRIYQASTSELFGNAPAPQSEITPFQPRSPYACAKLYSYWLTKNYREAYNMFICNGILFNHESPRRGETFVTRKITLGIKDIIDGKIDCIRLGNLGSKRDWGFAGDYIKAMFLMMQADKPDDYVVGTGETHTVREFCDLAFKYAGVPLTWEGSREWEIGRYGEDILVRVDPRYYRPLEVNHLEADPSRIKRELGWEPEVGFEKLVKMMVDNDLRVRDDTHLIDEASILAHVANTKRDEGS